ncbi:MAG TPA: cation:proton antiporter, partial [Gemmatimonadaceae bacterium]|nr:cation:proton antiporter [Gemmatimonadaceae bacterium]
DLLILFGLGVAVVVLFHRAKVPPIVGFLITGVICGPYGFGLVGDPHEVESLAEIGVVLLLFTVGIEFSLEQLARIRTFLLVGGGLQVGITIGTIYVIARLAGEHSTLALFLGMLVALSSTAIVLRLLADRGEMDGPHGQAALGILIFQDLCVVPMVLFTPFLTGEGTTAGDAVAVVVKGVLFIGGAIIAARWIVPRVLNFVVATRRREVFLLAIILLCLGTAWASAKAGLSLALGAFIAGLLIAESEYSHQALGEILPLREVFNSLFFVSIGMLFDVRTVLASPLPVVGALVVVVLVKTLVTTGASVALGQSLRIAILAGLALAQIGEFSFVLSKVGLSAGLLDAAHYQLFLAVAVGSMTLTPALLGAAPRIAAALEGVAPTRLAAGRAAPLALHTGAAYADHVIIVGYGVNGRNLARVLGRVGVPFVVIELNPQVVRRERERGRAIIYGDATRPEVLEHAGIRTARILVVAISDAAGTRGTVAVARRLNPHVHLIVRSRYVHEMDPLFALGTNEVIPEEFETSIEIFSRVLHRYLVPRDEIERQIRDIRRSGYEMFRTISSAHGPALGLQRFLSGLSFEVFRVDGGSTLAGRTLAESGVRDRSGASILAIHRADGSMLFNPAPEDRIDAEDLLLVLGTHEQISAAAPLFRMGDGRPLHE